MLREDAMTSNGTATDDQEARLNEVIAAYLRQVETRTAPPRAVLLAAHPDLADELGSFFADQDQIEELARPLRATLPAGSAQVPPGAMLGEYELQDEIARGGMGVVYRARDTRLQRIVALKMLKAGTLADAGQVRRFRAEAEAVACLDHPHIVPIYEVGEYEGQPYYAMKLITGGSLAQRVQELKREPRTAAQILAPVADAVQHAHLHGILHRDLKPSNILLASRREPQEEVIPGIGTASSEDCQIPLADVVPLVADFGLAKRLDAEPGVTLSGTIVGTPGYAAPEQAGGQSGATTAADIFGLGAILYECLTGKPPFRAETLLDTLRLAQESEPARPRSLNPRVDVDLETVCLKCLEKDPARRYASAREVAEDLRRYLAGVPVTARPVSGMARAWRFCRRNRLLTALVLVLLVGLTTTSWQWWRAEHHRAEAERHLIDAQGKGALAEERLGEIKRQQDLAEESFRDAHEAVANLYRQLSERPELRSTPALETLRKTLLNETLAYYQRFLKRRAGDPMLKAEMADIHMRVGDALRETDAPATALDPYRKALALRRELAQAAPREAARQEAVAEALFKLALVHKGLSQLQEAQKALEEALAIRRPLAEADRSARSPQLALVRTYNNLALVQQARGRYTEARASHTKALAIVEPAARAYPDDMQVLHLLPHVWGNVGVVEELMDHVAEARTAHEKAVAYQEDFNKRVKVPSPEMLADLASQYRYLAGWHRRHGKLEDAVPPLEKALSLLKEAAPARPHLTRFTDDLAVTYQLLGEAERMLGRKTEALAHLDQARRLQEKVAALYPAGSLSHHRLAFIWYQLGLAAGTNGQRELATHAYEQARVVREAILAVHPNSADDHYQLASTLHNLALEYGRAGKSDDALQTLNQAIRHQELALEQVPKNLVYRDTLVLHYRVVGEFQRQLGSVREALVAQKQRLRLCPDQANLHADVARELALCVGVLGKTTPADQGLRRECADLAVQALQKAVALGYKGGAKLVMDAAFDPLRGRDDFEAVVSKLSAKE
jgi:serine/threonine-protein kinase